MPEPTFGVRALPLAELIGAPLAAIVRADALAARATLEYVEQVGFVPRDAGEELPAGAAEAGHLRMAEFRYRKLDENQQESEFVASIPVLALVPIPSLQVKTARLSLVANVTDVVVEQKERAGAERPEPTLGPVSFPFLRRPELIAKLAPASGPKNQEVRDTFHLEVQLSVEQADITVGLEKLSNLMDLAIRERKVPPPG